MKDRFINLRVPNVRARFALLALLVLAVPSCDKEDPTTIGAPLVENGAVRTFEYTLDPSQYLVQDTSFSAFRPPVYAFRVLANSYQDALNAHVLAKFAVDPFVAVLNASNETVIDSVPVLQSGVMVLPIDSVETATEGPVLLKLYRAGEAWDSTAVSWTTREPNGVPWATPGGTRGILIDTATYTGGDSVVFHLDTLSIKEWRDDPTASNGVLITAESPHARLITGVPNVRVSVKTTIGDTTVTFSNSPFVSLFINDPPVPAASTDPRVGGVPHAFRSIFEVRPDLADLSVPCPFTPTCTVKLRNTTIDAADLLLQPSASPPGYVPEAPLTILAFTLLPSPQVPLVRSPLGLQAGFLTVGPASFESGATPAKTPLSVTGFVRDLVTPIDTTTFKSRYLTLLQGVPATFGYASFLGQPKLRLRLSVAQEIQLP